MRLLLFFQNGDIQYLVSVIQYLVSVINCYRYYNIINIKYYNSASQITFLPNQLIACFTRLYSFGKFLMIFRFWIHIIECMNIYTISTMCFFYRTKNYHYY